MSSERFNPEESAAVQEFMLLAELSRNAYALGRALQMVSRDFGKLDLQVIERIFRIAERPTYLLALPIDLQPSYESRLPHALGMLFPYHVAFTVRGEDALQMYSLTYKENFDRLPETGILYPKQGSLLSRMHQAPNN